MIISWYLAEHALSIVYTENKQTLNTASTHNGLPPLHFHNYKVAVEYSFTFMHASLQIDCHQLVVHDSSKIQSALHIPMVVSSITNQLIPSTHWASQLTISRLSTLPLTVPKYSTSFAQSSPPCGSPNVLDYCDQLHLIVHTITASISITEFTWTWPLSASLGAYNLGFQLQMWPPWRIATWCGSRFTS